MKSNEINPDWRAPNNITVSEDTILLSGIKIPKGTKVNIVANINAKKDNNITFTIPNASALFLNASFKASKRASEIKEKSTPRQSNQNVNSFDSESAIYDFFEERFSSIILAINAIEAFANESIPENFEYIHHGKSQIILDLDRKEKIERYVSIDEKISTILPEVFSCPQPRNHACWEKFKKLRQLRDRITHLKTNDRRFIHGSQKNIWNDTFPIKRPHEMAFSIIYYFAKHKSPILPWVLKFDDLMKTKENHGIK